MRDDEMFPSPAVFDPERFLHTDDSRFTSFELPFGFGRRICPGMHLARNSLFINVVRLLWAFDILPVEGRPLPDVWDYTDGFNSVPRALEARFVPRNEAVRECVERTMEESLSASQWKWG